MIVNQAAKLHDLNLNHIKTLTELNQPCDFQEL